MFKQLRISSKISLALSFIFSCAVATTSQIVIAAPGEVTIGGSKILKAEEWDSDKRDKISINLVLNSEHDDIETCGIILETVTSNTGEALEANFGFSESSDFLVNEMKSGFFARKYDVGFYAPTKKAKTLTISGSFCVFLPSESGDQMLLTENALANPHALIKHSKLDDLNLSLAIFTNNTWQTDQQSNAEIVNNADGDEAIIKSAFSEKYGNELGMVVFDFLNEGSICCGPGSIRIIGKGPNLQKIAKIAFLKADKSEAEYNGKGAAVASGPQGVVKMDYGVDLRGAENPILAIHLINDRNLVRIPFELTADIPSE